MSRAWLFLLVAAAFEIMFAIGTKLSHGWTNLPGSIITIIGGVLGPVFLVLATKDMPLSLAYVVWVGIGAAGTILYGVLVLKEPMDILRAACMLAIVAGVAGLKYLSGKAA